LGFYDQRVAYLERVIASFEKGGEAQSTS
jgi:hypothetical protein